MTWTPTTLTLKEADGTEQPIVAYTDGTNFSCAHSLLDDTGAIISPAKEGTLATVAAAQGTSGTGITQPTGGAGILGWLSGIFNKLNTSVAVTGTFWQATQPVSGTVTANAGTGTMAVSAAALPLPSGAATAADQSTQITALGAPGDSAVTSPASSASIIAALKGILTGVNAATPAGANLIGKVALDAPRAYTSSTLTRPADTTTYAAGDLVANNTTAGSVASGTLAISGTNDMLATMVGLILEKSTTTFANAIFKVHFFSAAPSVNAGDNGAFTPQFANYLGAWDIPSMASGSDKATGEGRPVSGSPMVCQPESGATTIRWFIEARGAYAPGNAETFILKGKFV